jgi:hypothetical protein
VCHYSKFILVLNKTVIVKFILIHRALMIEGDRIIWAQFSQWDYPLYHSLHFNLPSDSSLEATQKKTIGAFLHLCYLNVLRLLDCFPMGCMLHVQFFRYIADCVWG